MNKPMLVINSVLILLCLVFFSEQDAQAQLQIPFVEKGLKCSDGGKLLLKNYMSSGIPIFLNRELNIAIVKDGTKEPRYGLGNHDPPPPKRTIIRSSKHQMILDELMDEIFIFISSQVKKYPEKTYSFSYNDKDRQYGQTDLCSGYLDGVDYYISFMSGYWNEYWEKIIPGKEYQIIQLHDGKKRYFYGSIRGQIIIASSALSVSRRQDRGEEHNSLIRYLLRKLRHSEGIMSPNKISSNSEHIKRRLNDNFHKNEIALLLGLSSVEAKKNDLWHITRGYGVDSFTPDKHKNLYFIFNRDGFLVRIEIDWLVCDAFCDKDED